MPGKGTGPAGGDRCDGAGHGPLTLRPAAGRPERSARIRRGRWSGKALWVTNASGSHRQAEAWPEKTPESANGSDASLRAFRKTLQPAVQGTEPRGSPFLRVRMQPQTRTCQMQLHRGRLIDHIHLRAADLAATARFYRAVLEALGIPLWPTTNAISPATNSGSTRAATRPRRATSISPSRRSTARRAPFSCGRARCRRTGQRPAGRKILSSRLLRGLPPRSRRQQR